MRWMLQHKDDELPFDYRQAQCLVPVLCLRDYARAFQLFSGLSNFVTLRSQGDESLVLSVEEKDFWCFLDAESKTIRYYQYRNKSKVCHSIPAQVISLLRDRFYRSMSDLQVGVIGNYVVFTDVMRGNRADLPRLQEGQLGLREAESTVVWCEYALANENDYDGREAKAFGLVDGLALFKHPALKHGDVLMLACDNRSLLINNEKFEHFEQYANKVKPVSVAVRRFTFARLLLRVMRFSRGLCTIYLAFSGQGVKMIVPDVVAFIRAIQ